MEKSQFLIVGCQRSGTTLLRLILDSHPRVICHDELVSYDLLESGGMPANPEEGLDLVGYKVPIWTELLVEYPTFFDRFRHYRILFLQRRLREVVASLLTVPNFFDANLASIQTWWKDSNRSFRELCGHYDVMRLTRPLSLEDQFELAILYWQYKNRVYDDLVLAGYETLKVQYGELVTRPKVVLREVTRFLGLDWHESLLQHHEIPHRELTPNGLIAIGDTRADRPIDQDSVNKYRDVLTLSQLERLEEVEEENAVVV